MTVKKFNRLTPGQEERLNLLIEECAEVVQAAGKILRHGYESTNPDNPFHAGNRADLQRELGHVVSAIDLLVKEGEIDLRKVRDAAEGKTANLHRYLHHQERGCDAR